MASWQKELRLLIYFIIFFVAVTMLLSGYFILRTDQYLDHFYEAELESEVEIVRFFIERDLPLIELPSTPFITSIRRSQSETKTPGTITITGPTGKYQITPNRSLINRVRATNRLYLLFIILISISVITIDLYLARRILLRRQDLTRMDDRSQSLTQFVEETLNKIKEKETIVSKVATIVSHELKNSLSTILGFIRSGKVDESKLNLEIKNMLEFLDRIALFTRPIKVKKEEISINYLIRDIIADFNHLQSVSVDFHSDGEIRSQTDPILLEHAIKNILKNSIESFEGPGVIKINLKGEKDAILVTIIDNGPGFDPAIEKRIFTPFFTTKPDGTGLGLTIVKRFIEAIGGEVALKSVKGKGTEVRLRLPYA
ncbi:MAG TPA: hypothetical protein EYP24_00020 [bacterium (Candidatus Stahlbacteria)]|nr:hypothetical protein [Candidatus Stahlbacteria bacterium]